MGDNEDPSTKVEDLEVISEEHQDKIMVSEER